MSMSTSSEEILEKLQELILDEDRIVTLPFLSKTLEISVQESTNILKKYVDDQRKITSNEIAATYVLTGTLKNGKGKAVFMVKEPDLQSKRDLFEELVSEVVFSVQKSKSVDFNIVALVDWFEGAKDDKPVLGAVVTKNCSKRTLKFKKLPTPPPPTIKGKSSFFIPKPEIKSEKSVKSVEPSPEVKNKSSGGIANLFSKAAASKPNQEIKLEKTKSLQQNKKPKGGLSNFLTKNVSQSSQFSNNSGNEDIKSKKNQLNGKNENNVEESKKTVKTQSDLAEDSDNVMEVDSDEVEKVDNPPEKSSKPNKSQDEKASKQNKSPEEKAQKQNKSRKEKKNSSKRRRDDSNEKSSKKRKRIIERNDSDSDDIFEKDEDDVIEQSDEEPERVPSPIPKMPLAPKNKRRKAIDKTYQDEEGFIVTKTEYIYETASEDEVEESPPVSKTPVKSVPNLIDKKSSASSENDTPTQKGPKGKKAKKNNLQNQPTLMNFFKKK